ncbi:retrovirus-related pol polyprotein from transposon TNT 1-94 [Tanacetum coccineum]
MTTLVEFMIIADADNRPLMTKKYEELSVAKKLQDDCDLKATNIILQGLPPDVYAIVNHHKVAKEIWDRGETLYQFYWRFAQLINNMNVVNMSMRPVQVNTKFLNSLPPEWSKFVTNVKLARDLHTTNFDQLYSYLEQHDAHANETRLLRKRYQDPFAFVANFNQPPSHITNYHSQSNATQFPQWSNSMNPQVHSSHSYSPMYVAHHLSQPQISHSFIPPSYEYQSHMDHQTSYVPQIVYHSPPVSTQPTTKFPQLDSRGQERVVKCYNCQGEGHMARKCTQPKRPRNAAWFKEKAMLAEAREFGQILDEEQLEFLTDPGIPDGQATQTTIPNVAAFQNDDLNAYDSDYDDVSNAKAVLMANLSNYGSDVILEVPHSESYHNDLDNQSVHAMQDYKQTPVVDFPNNEITSDSNIIPYS